MANHMASGVEFGSLARDQRIRDCEGSGTVTYQLGYIERKHYMSRHLNVCVRENVQLFIYWSFHPRRYTNPSPEYTDEKLNSTHYLDQVQRMMVMGEASGTCTVVKPMNDDPISLTL